MRVNSACQVKAFTLGIHNPIDGSLLFNFTVDYMTVDKGKTTFVATGNKNPANGYQFLWVGAKQ